MPKNWPTRVNIFTKSAYLCRIHHLGFELNTIHMDRLDTSSGRVFNDEAQSEDENDNLLFLPRVALDYNLLFYESLSTTSPHSHGLV